MPRSWSILLAVLLAAPTFLPAQSAQRFSVQGSGALLFPSREDATFANQTRLGYEAQLRYTPSRLSIGAGYQRSTVYRLTAGFTAALSLAFLEPRYVVTANDRLALYVAGRVGFGSLICSEACNANNSYLTYGGGGGVLVRLSGRAAMDVGAQYFVVSDTFDSGYAMLRLGLSLGL